MPSRDDVLRTIRDRLDRAGMRYEILVEEPDSATIRIDAAEIGTEPIVQLEESLARDGIRFDTGYDVVRRKRDWFLDTSLEAEGMKQTRRMSDSRLSRARSVTYREG